MLSYLKNDDLGYPMWKRLYVVAGLWLLAIIYDSIWVKAIACLWVGFFVVCTCVHAHRVANLEKKGIRQIKASVGSVKTWDNTVEVQFNTGNGQIPVLMNYTKEEYKKFEKMLNHSGLRSIVYNSNTNKIIGYNMTPEEAINTGKLIIYENILTVTAVADIAIIFIATIAMNILSF